MVNDKDQYMNIDTDSVDTYAGWWYENETAQRVNAVDLGEVVKVEWIGDEQGEWIETSILDGPETWTSDKESRPYCD